MIITPEDWYQIIWPALIATVQMVLLSSFFSIGIGSVLGILLYMTKQDGITPSRWTSMIVGTIVNIGRSIPFVILIIAIFPFTKFFLGTSIGLPAAIFSLTVAAVPFVARVMEATLNEVDPGVIDAAQSMGATKFEIIYKVVLLEAAEGIVAGITITMINIVGYSAMAGIIGGGGLGDIAKRYGFDRYRNDILLVTVVLLVILVQLIQTVGNILSRKIVVMLYKVRNGFAKN